MKSTRLATLCVAIVPALFLSSSLFSQIVTTNASDNAGNYAGNWGDGSNGGTGFQAWTFNSGAGTGGAGRFIGNPANVGIAGMSESSFALYANPAGSGAFIDAVRVFSSPLAVGDTLEFKWAINWDSAGGNKGFSLSAGSTEVINVNNGSSQDITLNGNNVNFGYGTNAMTWSFTRTATNSVRVVANDRDGNGTYSNNLTVTNGAIDRIKFYAAGLSDDNGGNREPYFNDFLITSTTADVTPPVINLAAGVDKVTWVATGTSVTLANTDVTASDAITTSPTVTFLPATVDTTVDGLTAVTYTATDAAGNAATVTRVIAVGAAAPGYHNLRFPAALTVNTNSTESAYGEIFIDGATPGAGAASGVQAWIGVNSANSDPSTWDGSAWSAASYVGEEGNNDNYQGVIAGTNRAPGTYYFATRFQLGTNSSNPNFFYGGIGTDGVGGTWGGTRQVAVGGVTNTVTNGNGVLSVVPVRNVTFAVDMGVQIFKGAFNPATNGVEVRGDFNGFSGSPLVQQGTSTIYTNTLAINGTNETVLNYKFFGNGTNELAWENRGNRSLSLASSNQTVPTAFFSDLSEARKITFRVDMSVQAAKNAFNTNSGSVYIAGSFNGWNTTNTPLLAQGNGFYAAEVTVDGPVSGIAYKFLKGTTTGDYEQVADRTVSAVLPNLDSSTLDVVLFGNDDGVAPTDISLSASSLAENNAVNAVVGTLSSTDATVGGDTHTYSLVTGTGDTDNAAFNISGSDLRATVAFNFETKSSYSIRVRSTDSKGNSFEEPLNITVTDVAEGATFSGWSGGGTTNSELVGKYAIGGATNISAASEKPVSAVDSNTLSLSAIVRTNDTNLTVVGEAGGSLTNWSTNGVSVTASTNTNGVPEGHQRQVFSVERTNGPTRQFLRLKATLTP